MESSYSPFTALSQRDKSKATGRTCSKYCFGAPSLWVLVSKFINFIIFFLLVKPGTKKKIRKNEFPVLHSPSLSKIFNLSTQFLCVRTRARIFLIKKTLRPWARNVIHLFSGGIEYFVINKCILANRKIKTRCKTVK